MCVRTSLVAAVVAVFWMTTYAQADYIAAVKADSPIAYWRFDSDTGGDATTADDEMNANDGTYKGAVSIVAGPGIGVANNKAADFSSVSNYIDVGKLGSLGSNLGSGVTVEMWLKSSTDLTERPFGVWTAASRTAFFVSLDEHPDGTDTDDFIRAGGKDASLVAKQWFGGVASDTDVTDGTWNYLAITMDWGADAISVYTADLGDSSATSWTTTIATDGNPSAFANFARSLFVGALNSKGTAAMHYSGLIDELAVYDKVLTESEVNGHVAATIPEPSTLVLLATGLIGLLCYAWRKRK